MSQYKHYIWRCCLKEHLQIPVLSPCPLTSEQCKRHILTARGTWTRVGRHGSTRGNQQSNPLHIRRPRNVYALCAVLLLHTISRRPARMGVIWVDLLLCEEDWRALQVDLGCWGHWGGGTIMQTQGMVANSRRCSGIKMSYLTHLNHSICFFIFKGLKHDGRRRQRSQTLYSGGRWAQAQSERTVSEFCSSIYRTLESSLSTLCDNGDAGIEQRNVKVTYALLSLAKNRK